MWIFPLAEGALFILVEGKLQLGLYIVDLEESLMHAVNYHKIHTYVNSSCNK